MTFPPVATSADLVEIIDQVWVSYLDPDGVSPLVHMDPAQSASDLYAAVSITGSWHGHVVVACSTDASRACAAAFLAMKSDEVSDDDVIDVLGELANIVGGNVKSMLPPGCFVSLPYVVNAPADTLRLPSAVKVCELAGRWDEEPICVSLWQSQNELKGAHSS